MTTDEDRTAAQEAERACDRCGDPLGEQFNCYQRTLVEGDPTETVTDVEGLDAELFFVCQGCQMACELELAAYQRGFWTKDARRAQLARDAPTELERLTLRMKQFTAVATSLLGVLPFVLVGEPKDDEGEEPRESALRIALELRLQVEDLSRLLQWIVRVRREEHMAKTTH